MKVVCPQDVKKMLLKQVQMVWWKKLAAIHECGELKAEMWPEPIEAMLRRRTNEVWWKDKNRNVMRKLVVEGGWVQQRMCNIGWSHERKCRDRD